MIRDKLPKMSAFSFAMGHMANLQEIIQIFFASPPLTKQIIQFHITFISNIVVILMEKHFVIGGFYLLISQCHLITI